MNDIVYKCSHSLPVCRGCALLYCRITTLEAELMESARLHGMGSEREASLMAENVAFHEWWKRFNRCGLCMPAKPCNFERCPNDYEAIIQRLEAENAKLERVASAARELWDAWIGNFSLSAKPSLHKKHEALRAAIAALDADGVNTP